MSYQSLIKVDLLTRENYDTWKIQIESLLVKNDYWDFVNGSVKMPSEKEKIEEWIKTDRKAKADLILSVSPPLLKDIKNCSTSHEVWTKLKELLDSKGPARKATLLKTLILKKAKGDDDIINHISKFFDIVDKLKSIDISIDDDLLSILLLYSLPDSFENFRVAIEARDELPEPSALKTKIIEEYNARSTQPSTSEALIVNQHFQKYKGERYSTRPKSKITPRRKIMCYNCKRFGHKMAECKNKMQPREKLQIVEESTFIISDEIEKTDVKWILDSGATSHMVNDIRKFLEISEVKNIKLNLANEGIVDVKGKGIVIFKTKKGNKIKLKDVLYVPELRTNLLSVSKITQSKHNITFNKDSAIITNDKDAIVLEAEKRDSLYCITEQEVHEANIVSENDDLTLWHQRYGHLNYQTLIEMIKNNKIKGVNPRVIKRNLSKCEICIQAKQTQRPFPMKLNNRSRTPLELIHTDVCGPINITSAGGAQYFITFTDDATRWTEIYFMKHKHEVLDMFKKYKAMVENFTNSRIKALRSDNGKEYINNAFSSFLEKAGIQHQVSAEYTPQQNGVSERKNRTLVEMARTMIIQSKLPQSLWAEAVSTANYIRNRCASSSINGEIPYKLWKGRIPEVGYFKVFGTLAYVLQKGPGKKKFSAKSTPFYLVGYCENAKAYRLWSKQTNKIIKSRDVVFVNECGNNPVFSEHSNEVNNDCNEHRLIIVDTNKELKQDEVLETETNKEDANEDNETEKQDVNIENKINGMKKKKGRPRKIRTGLRGRPRKVTDIDKSAENQREDTELRNLAADTSCQEDFEGFTDESSELDEGNVSGEFQTPDESFFIAEKDPNNIEEVIRDPYKYEWEKAILEELKAHQKNQTWKIIEKPPNAHIINCRWVFTSKYDKDKRLIRRKARLVAKGCSQIPGIDFQETYAPVARQRSIRILIAIAIKWNLQLYQFDVTTAYLNGDLKENIYMKIPQYYEKFYPCNKSIENKVCKLQKAIYGLKQSGRIWYQKLDNQLRKIGCIRMKNEPCIYIYRNENDLLIIGVYVDDIIVASNTEDLAKWFKEQLDTHFEIKDMGKPKYFLGIEFNYLKDGSILLTQQKFIQKILEKFNMMNCNPANLPADPNVKLSKDMCPKASPEQIKMTNVPYQNLIGSLLYLAVTTRPDIIYIVSVLSQYNNNYRNPHWTAAKRVIRYLKKTSDYGLFFRNTQEDLHGYVDADWASNIDDRKSYTGYLFKLSNGPISWEARKQKTTALSTAEAEYMALTEATKEALYLRNLLDEIGFRGKKPIVIYNDNQSAQTIARNDTINSRNKHIDIKHHFIRDAVAEKKIELHYLNSASMPADILTKTLTTTKFENCISKLGLSKLNE